VLVETVPMPANNMILVFGRATGTWIIDPIKRDAGA
jgi:hypothetical protein